MCAHHHFRLTFFLLFDYRRAELVKLERYVNNLNFHAWSAYFSYWYSFCLCSWPTEAKQPKPRWVLETSFCPLMGFPQTAWITWRRRTRLRPAQATSASLCRSNYSHNHITYTDSRWISVKWMWLHRLLESIFTFAEIIWCVFEGTFSRTTAIRGTISIFALFVLYLMRLFIIRNRRPFAVLMWNSPAFLPELH